MTSNEELKKLMVDTQLSQSKVAEMTESSIETVKGWCSKTETSRYRNMPQSKLKLLKFELR